MARNKLLHNQNDTDPMGTVANLFDVAMVVARKFVRHFFR